MRIGRIALIALLLAVGFAVTPSHAVCAGYLMSSWGVGTTGVYNYAYVGADVNPAAAGIKGWFWQPNAFGAFNNGLYDAATGAGPVDPGWFVPYPAVAPDAYYVYANTGNGEVVGCTTGNVYTMIQVTTADGKGSKFFMAGIDATFFDQVVFDYSRLGSDWHLVEVGNPGVAVTGKVGQVLTMNIAAPAGIEQGYIGNIPAPVNTWRLMKATGTAEPGRAATGWTLVQALASPTAGITGFTFDCSTLPAGQDLFLAAQMSFDGGQKLGDVVGRATQVRCNSTLANPKFKNIDKKPKK